MNINRVSFSGGKIDSVGFELPYFVVYFMQWDGRRLKLKFEDVVYLELFELCSDTNDTMVSNDTSQIDSLKSRLLGNGADPSEYSYFKFEQVTFTSSDSIDFLTVIYLNSVIEEI